MPYWFNIDHKVIVLSALGVTSGIAIYSTYKLMSERQQRNQQSIYETEKLVNEYLVFHYGSPKEVVEYDFGPRECVDFPKRCAELCLKHFKGDAPSRALDIGCAVGRSTFELTQRFDEVIGIDYSQAFIDTCETLKRVGKLPYYVPEEGDLVIHLDAVVPKSLKRNNVTFMKGDACKLPKNLGQFGCVLAANLICRLHHPFDFLNSLADLVAPNGILVITSPYTWLEEYTEKSTWLGGYQDDNGREIRGFDTLKRVLGPNFNLVDDDEMPFFIRETSHKNQWSVAHATIWRRKS